MYKDTIIVGLMPTRRPVFNINTAREEYDKIMPIIRKQMPKYVKFVDVDDICEQGMATHLEDITKVVDKFRAAKVDALFMPFCDFGCEEVVASVAKAFKIPTLIWGSRDKVSTYEKREKETQCGLFAATKVLRNYGVTFSYIFNCEYDSPELTTGFEKFVRVASVMKKLRGLRVAEIGDRPGAFFSVIHNQLELIRNFDITVVPIGLNAIKQRTDKIVEENGKELNAYIADITARIDFADMEPAYMRRMCAGKMAIEAMMKEENCLCSALDCGGVSQVVGIPACAVQGELSDAGLPSSCETDVWGAISQLICQAATLGDDTEFLADWTYRHPTNDNAELLWHGGPFAYSLARKDRKPRMKKMYFRADRFAWQAYWEMKQGDLTMLRMDELDGKYYMFCDEAKTTTGPETTGTWVWMEVDSWKKWEEKLMFGPYIHHVAGVYGKYKDIMREVCRYLNCVQFDEVANQGPYCL
jgi:L-fucose isomerase-like protein